MLKHFIIIATGCATSCQCKIVTKFHINIAFCVQRPNLSAAAIFPNCLYREIQDAHVYGRLLSPGNICVNDLFLFYFDYICEGWWSSCWPPVIVWVNTSVCCRRCVTTLHQTTPTSHTSTSPLLMMMIDDDDDDDDVVKVGGAAAGTQWSCEWIRPSVVGVVSQHSTRPRRHHTPRRRH